MESSKNFVLVKNILHVKINSKKEKKKLLDVTNYNNNKNK